MLTDIKHSISVRIIFATTVIFLLVNISIFIGVTLLNKKAFLNLEKDKVKLIATTYAPLIATNMFLNMDSQIQNLINKIMINKSIYETQIYRKGRLLFYKKNPTNIKNKIQAEAVIYQPNSTSVMGKIVIIYSSHHFSDFMRRYIVLLSLSVLSILIIFIMLSFYIKHTLKPLKVLATLLKHVRPNKLLKVPFKNRPDEIGMIANAISLVNKKNVEYSKNLEILTEELKEVNKNLKQRVKEELEQIREKDKQLIQQSRLAQMGEMINMIAHQWRQPLSAISSTTNNLNLKLMLDDIDKDFFEHELNLIEEYSQHLSKTIDDFRNFFKENKEKETVNIKELINETLNIVKASLTSHDITVKEHIQCDTNINTYPSELKQVILNLIKNAQDALMEKEIKEPYIEIKTQCDDKYTNITVEDNAGGIPDDILPKIFEPYFSTKLEKDGTGIGLYMSKTIIEDHCHGKLQVKNNKNGAVFTIKLPIKKEDKV